MNDLTPPPDEAVLLARLREQLEFEHPVDKRPIALLRRLAEALEALPPPTTADLRVQCVFDVLDSNFLTGTHEVLALPLSRALRAAWPREQAPLEPHLARRFYNGVAGCELILGRNASGASALAIAYRLAEQLNDAVGQAGVWCNLALMMSGCGDYERVLQCATQAIAAGERSLSEPEAPKPRAVVSLGIAHMHRGNALHRMGRLEAALAEFDQSFRFYLASAGGRPWASRASIDATVAIAEIHLERGERAKAAVVLAMLEAATPQMPTEDFFVPLSIERIRGLLCVAQGEREAGIAALERVLSEALRHAPAGASDDGAMDALYSLELAHRLAGQPDQAREVLRRIGVRLRANAEQTLSALAEEPVLGLGRDAASSMLELDAFLASRSRALHAGPQAAAASLQQLVALAAQASSIEEGTGEHGVRVAALARLVANALHLDEVSARLTTLAALVHDAGKFGVAYSLLTRREPLGDEDQDELDAHADDGAALVERAAIPDRGRLAEIVRLHHQPYDGVGAKRPLRGEAIPIEARIVAACDRFDARVMGRPRAPAVSIDEALRELLRVGGRELDPKVVAVLIEVVRRLRREHPDLMAYLAEDAEHYDFTAARRVFRKAAGAQ